MAQSSTRHKTAAASAALPAQPPEAHDGARATLLRQSVLDAAALLFAERGYAGTNLQDVATALGMSRPSLYYYFANKEKILEALLEEVTFAIERQSAAIAGIADLAPADALRLVVSAHAAWLLEHGTHFRVIDRSETELPTDLRERHSQSKRAILHNVTLILERGITSGSFRPVDARVAAFSMIGMCSWTAWWFKPDGRRTISEVADAIGDMAAGSVLRPDAHRNRTGSTASALQILKDDVAHLERLIAG